MARFSVAVVAVVALAAFVGTGGAQEPSVHPAQDPPRTGTFETQFSAKHPLGAFAEITRRMRWPKGEIAKHDPEAGYELADETFFVHVPEDYVDDGSFGLMVWISPGAQGNCARDWPAVFADHKLIHVGAHGAGNQRFVWCRIALALDAVHNMTQRYALDPGRIYVAGHSGGGRCASTLGLLWPDVFGGGIYANGTNHYKPIRRPGGERRVWPAKLRKPTGPRLRRAQRESRHVFVNGETDVNRVHSELVERSLRRERFRYTHVVTMTGRGHEAPDAEWLARCIGLLDAPLAADRPKKRPRSKSRGGSSPTGRTPARAPAAVR